MRGALTTYALRAVVGALLFPSVRAQIKVSSFDGNVTEEELKSFNDFVTTLKPGADNIGNEWAQGHSGEQTKAMGLVYQIGGQQQTLDQMLRFCDAVLSERNDLAKAPVGQHKIWTGGIDLSGQTMSPRTLSRQAENRAIQLDIWQTARI